MDAVRVSNLTKIYSLYDRPMDRLREAVHPRRKKYHREFAALKDLTFAIPVGQIIGIIGKNGSGKSTLLKILTGVLTPSSGSVQVNGKIAALLELGAGFNPELTGIENVFLNGLIMGYNKEEMSERLQEIIEFADIADFIQQPVKMYSSGMFVRLAFAVAISVDPDILIIDEALSVGDIRFQQKCIRKIRDFFERGKTVIFVGHDLSLVNSFCTHCLWINDGVLLSQGAPLEVTKEYSSFMAYGMKSDQKSDAVEKVETSHWIQTSAFQSFGDKEAVISAIRVLTESGSAPHTVLGGERIVIEIKIEAQKIVEKPIIGFVVKDRLGNNIFGANTLVHDIEIAPIIPGESSCRISFEFPYLSNGNYSMTLALADGCMHDHVQKHWIHDCFIFHVSNPLKRYSNNDGIVLEKKFDFQNYI